MASLVLNYDFQIYAFGRPKQHCQGTALSTSSLQSDAIVSKIIFALQVNGFGKTGIVILRCKHGCIEMCVIVQIHVLTLGCRGETNSQQL